MKDRIFYGGWILTLLATLVATYGDKVTSERIWPALFFLFCAACTFSLLRNPTFPKRAEGLATSWMGQLLIAMSMIVYVYYFNPTFQALSNQTSPTDASVTLMDTMLVVELFLGGCVNALLAYWAEFGYGFVTLMALAPILFPDKREKLTRDIQKYPSRWGWLVVIISLFPSWFAGFYVIQINRESNREMARIKLLRQQSSESGSKLQYFKDNFSHPPPPSNTSPHWHTEHDPKH